MTWIVLEVLVFGVLDELFFGVSCVFRNGWLEIARGTISSPLSSPDVVLVGEGIGQSDTWKLTPMRLTKIMRKLLTGSEEAYLQCSAGILADGSRRA